ncbi:MAG: hypothetical protein Q4A41_00340 [Bacillota bacterium]|nr:hypothetical protein [Bacillota bacterium]
MKDYKDKIGKISSDMASMSEELAKIGTNRAKGSPKYMIVPILTVFFIVISTLVLLTIWLL